MLVLHAKYFPRPRLAVVDTSLELVDVSQQRLLVQTLDLETLLLVAQNLCERSVLLNGPICKSELVPCNYIFRLEVLDAAHQTIIKITMAEEEKHLDESMEMLYGALIRLDNEPENEQLLEWVKNVCQPEYGVVDGLVANFIDFLDDKAYVTKILKILK